MKNPYQLSKSEVLENLGVTNDGRTSEQAAELLQKNGENVLRETKKQSTLMVFLSQFADLLVIILIIAAITAYELLAYFSVRSIATVGTSAGRTFPIPTAPAFKSEAVERIFVLSS